MTAENKPSFKTEAIEVIKSIGLLLRFGFDPTQDPLFIEWRRKRETSLAKPETLANRIKSTINDIRRKQ